MCTSLTLPLPDGTQLFGRTLDWHEHFHEKILYTPQGFMLGSGDESRYAILGTGTEVEGYPLYADGINEAGLGMAGLRFAQSAYYMPASAVAPEGILCLAPWELIPYVLGKCATLGAVRDVLTRVRIVDRAFSLQTGGKIPTAPLHWHIADSCGESLVVEATARGTVRYNAQAGVMANDPPYPAQMAAYERSRGERGIPTGYDSVSRFVRAARLRAETTRMLARDNCVDAIPVDCFFEMAKAVSPPEGAVPSVDGRGWQTTLYTCCMDGARGRYFYTMAGDPEIHEASFALFR